MHVSTFVKQTLHYQNWQEVNDGHCKYKVNKQPCILNAVSQNAKHVIRAGQTFIETDETAAFVGCIYLQKIEINLTVQNNTKLLHRFDICTLRTTAYITVK